MYFLRESSFVLVTAIIVCGITDSIVKGEVRNSRYFELTNEEKEEVIYGIDKVIEAVDQEFYEAANQAAEEAASEATRLADNLSPSEAAGKAVKPIAVKYLQRVLKKDRQVAREQANQARSDLGKFGILLTNGIAHQNITLEYLDVKSPLKNVESLASNRAAVLAKTLSPEEAASQASREVLKELLIKANIIFKNVVKEEVETYVYKYYSRY